MEQQTRLRRAIVYWRENISEVEIKTHEKSNKSNKDFIINLINILIKAIITLAIMIIWLLIVFYLIHFIGWLWEFTKFK